MKNIKKKIGRIVLVLVICFAGTALSGCTSLADLNNEVEKQADGSLRMGEYEYLELVDKGDTLEHGFIKFHYGQKIYPKDSNNDIPALLRPTLGEEWEISADEIIIMDDDGTYYCRSDYYEETKKALNGELEIKGYNLTNNVNKDDGSKGSYDLTADQWADIQEILATAKRQKEEDVNYDYDDEIASIDSYSISYVGFPKVTIYRVGNDYYLWTIENEEYYMYKVPKNKKRKIDEMLYEPSALV